MRIAAKLLIASLLIPQWARAQMEWIAPGARVRIDAPAQGLDRRIASLVALRAETVLVRLSGSADTLSIPFRAVRRLDVSFGRGRHVGRGMMVGFLTGTGLGAGAGLVAGNDPPDADLAYSARNKAVVLGVVLGSLGAVVGGIVGAFPTERWERLRLVATAELP